MATNSFMKKMNRALGRWCVMSLRSVARRTPLSIYNIFKAILLPMGSLIMQKKYRLAVKNLSRAYGPALSKQDVCITARRCIKNFGEALFELVYLIDRPQMLKDAIRLEGLEYLEASRAQGQGVILVGAHFGNFIMMYFRMVLAGYPTNVIMRRARDSKLEDYLSQFRHALGLKAIYDKPTRRCVLECLKALRKNEVLFILIDQNFGSDGRVFVDFFGQKSATATGPLVMAQRAQAVIHPIFMTREGPYRHVIKVKPAFKVSSSDSEEMFAKDNMERLSHVIEQEVRQSPYQWAGWLHHRWKTIPWEEQCLVDRENEAKQAKKHRWLKAIKRLFSKSSQVTISNPASDATTPQKVAKDSV